MNKLVTRNLVRDLPSKLFENDHSCVACQKGKQHKASCKTKLISSISHPLQMLHMDLFGPTFIRSINHKIYCLVVTDDYSRIDSSTKDVNNARLSINTASEYINTGSSNINTSSPIPNDTSMQYLEATGIFSGAYDDEDVGAKADLNNLATTMNVSPIPITRIDKDHPKDQIIGDINSATQTRRTTKITKEHAMVSDIKRQRRTNHKDYQNCLFACSLSTRTQESDSSFDRSKLDRGNARGASAI
ncbi:hypothetical protein Tco_1342283 [Tanacetum coccineum]